MVAPQRTVALFGGGVKAALLTHAVVCVATQRLDVRILLVLECVVRREAALVARDVGVTTSAVDLVMDGLAGAPLAAAPRDVVGTRTHIVG